MKIVSFGDLKRITETPSSPEHAEALAKVLTRDFEDSQPLSVANEIADLIPTEQKVEHDNLEGQSSEGVEGEDNDRLG